MGLSDGQLVAAITGIGGTLASVISFLFYQYKGSRDKADADKDAEIAWLRQQLADFRQTISSEAGQDRAVLEKLRDTLQQAATPPRTPRR